MRPVIAPTGGDGCLRTVRDATRSATGYGFIAMGVLVVWLVWVSGGQSSPADLWAGFTQFELGTIGASGYIPAAKAAIEREREQLLRERDAFRRFATEIESIPVSTRGHEELPPVGVGQTAATRGKPGNVRAAYRRTIMGLDHFDHVYGEELYENMSNELSDDVATAVVHGDQFSLQVKQTMMQQAMQASARRERLLETIDSERDSLEYARDQLRELSDVLDDDPEVAELSLTELFAYEECLDRSLRRCEQLLRTRQRDIHAESQFSSELGVLFLQTYLYEDLETNFPVLADGLQQYSRLESRQRAVHDEITYR